jgi:NAD(P)-dependent dehydrogenase (short-subunit alcohol dehydrogenase family)
VTAQAPIGSGFGWDSTADDVLTGIDLTGRLAIVTGGYSGIGVETTRALAGAGAHVVVPARRVEVAREAVADVAEVDELDLADLASVRAFADRFHASGRRIDIVINSAGVMVCPEIRVGKGWELQFAANHLGHFALVEALRPAFADDVRVVAVSSAGHQHTDIRWDDPHFERGYDKVLAYGQSKTANVLFAVQLSAQGVPAFAVHPGKILTPLQRHMERREMVGNGWIDEDGNPIDPTFKSPRQGAATQVWAATSPRLAGLGGLYLEDCDVARPNNTAEKGWGVRDYALDPASAARLWELSAQLTG